MTWVWYNYVHMRNGTQEGDLFEIKEKDEEIIAEWESMG